MRNSPLVSVVMPVYNCERYLELSLNSILQQTIEDFEFIIINDGSTDSSEDIIRSFADRRINLVNQKENKGIASSLNAGIMLAKGAYIARMDSDDISYPFRFARQVDFLRNNPDVIICGSHMNLIDQAGSIIKLQRKKVGCENIRLGLFFGETSIAHPSIMINASLYKKRGFSYNPFFDYAEDYDLFCRCSQEFRMENIGEPLIQYRLHEQSVSKQHSYLQRLAARRALKEHLQSLGLLFSEEDFETHSFFHLPIGIPVTRESTIQWGAQLIQWNNQAKAFCRDTFQEKIALVIKNPNLLN